jgi:hypothetical protein
MGMAEGAWRDDPEIRLIVRLVRDFMVCAVRWCDRVFGWDEAFPKKRC